MVSGSVGFLELLLLLLVGVSTDALGRSRAVKPLPCQFLLPSVKGVALADLFVSQGSQELVERDALHGAPIVKTCKDVSSFGRYQGCLSVAWRSFLALVLAERAMSLKLHIELR